MEGDTFQIHIGNLKDILLILTTHDDVSDTSTLRCKDLLFDTAYGQHLTTKGNLTSHSSVLANLSLGEGRGDTRSDGDTGRGSILGCSPLGHMDVNIPVVEDTVVNVQSLCMRLHIFQSQNSRLFHHITEVTCQREFVSLTF